MYMEKMIGGKMDALLFEGESMILDYQGKCKAHHSKRNRLDFFFLPSENAQLTLLEGVWKK